MITACSQPRETIRPRLPPGTCSVSEVGSCILRPRETRNLTLLPDQLGKLSWSDPPGVRQNGAVDLPETGPDDVLGQATRARLFAMISDLGRPAGTEELAQRLGIHPNGVRIHWIASAPRDCSPRAAKRDRAGVHAMSGRSLPAPSPGKPSARLRRPGPLARPRHAANPCQVAGGRERRGGDRARAVARGRRLGGGGAPRHPHRARVPASAQPRRRRRTPMLPG